MRKMGQSPYKENKTRESIIAVINEKLTKNPNYLLAYNDSGDNALGDAISESNIVAVQILIEDYGMNPRLMVHSKRAFQNGIGGARSIDWDTSDDLPDMTGLEMINRWVNRGDKDVDKDIQKYLLSKC